MHLKLK